MTFLLLQKKDQWTGGWRRCSIRYCYHSASHLVVLCFKDKDLILWDFAILVRHQQGSPVPAETISPTLFRISQLTQPASLPILDCHHSSDFLCSFATQREKCFGEGVRERSPVPTFPSPLCWWRRLGGAEAQQVKGPYRQLWCCAVCANVLVWHITHPREYCLLVVMCGPAACGSQVEHRCLLSWT